MACCRCGRGGAGPRPDRPQGRDAREGEDRMQLLRIVTMVAVALLGAIPSGTTAARELRFANFAPPAHTITASVIEKLDAAVSAATGGRITVRGYHGGELGAGPAEQYVRAVQGAADIVWGLPGYTSAQFPKTMIVELPGVVPPDGRGYRALWAAFADHLAAEFPGTKVLALWTSEPNVMIMREKVVRRPADLAGLKIRVAGATVAETVTALGGTPVQMPISQVYNALQTGLIDGVFTGASTLVDFRLDEVADVIVLGAPLGRLSFYTVMGLASYESLDAEGRAAIDAAAGEELSRSAEEAWLATAGAALDAARADPKNRVIELTAEEIAAFEQAVSGVTAGYAAKVGGEEVLAIMKAAARGG